jgi:hypothetical protein
MHHAYFLLRPWNGHQLDPDEQGVELNGTEEAFEMAVKTARAMLPRLSSGVTTVPTGLRVHDEQGRRLFTFRFTVRFRSPTTLVLGPDAAHNRRYLKRAKPPSSRAAAKQVRAGDLI